MDTQTLSWKALLFEGIIFILLGVFALAHPFLVAMSLDLIIGSILLIAGIVQGYRALRSLKDPRATTLLIGAGFALVAGLLLLTYPLTGLLTLTLILTGFFLFDGVAKMVNAMQFRPLRGWGWLFFSGMLSFILAILILTGLPTTAIWILGIYVAIYLLFLGFSLILFSLFIKKGA